MEQSPVGHTDRVRCVTVSADRTRIVTGSRDKTIRLWDAESAEPLGRPFVGHTSVVLSVAVSANIPGLLWDTQFSHNYNFYHFQNN